jgi:hypothetical protein
MLREAEFRGRGEGGIQDDWMMFSILTDSCHWLCAANRELSFDWPYQTVSGLKFGSRDEFRSHREFQEKYRISISVVNIDIPVLFR